MTNGTNDNLNFRKGVLVSGRNGLLTNKLKKHLKKNIPTSAEL